MAQFRFTKDTKLQDLPIYDNFMFQQVMKNERICKDFLEELLHIKIKNLTYVGTEEVIANLPDSKAVRLDLYVEDEQGKVYDIEMQTSDGARGELPKRVRYYCGSLDMQKLGKGESYTQLPELVVIFICTFDPFREGLGCYTFKRYCKEKRELEMGNGITVIYLNPKGSREGLSKKIVGLLKYLESGVPEGKLAEAMHAEVMQVRKREDVEVKYMGYRSAIWDAEFRGRFEGRAEGKAEGRAEEKADTALGMLKDKMAVTLIMKYTQLSLEKIQELAKSIGVAVVM